MPITVYRFAAACLFCLLFALSAHAGPKKDKLQGRLLQAIGSGDPADVRNLLDGGARADEPFDQSGLTPLMVAAMAGYGELVNVLLELGADKTLRNADGRTAADLARKTGKRGISDLLA